MQTIGERICEIKKYFYGEARGSNTSFANKLEVSGQVVSNWFGRGDGIGKDVISKILAAFPEVNPAWLQLGDGEMLINQPKPEDDKSPEAIMKELNHWKSLAEHQHEIMSKLADTVLKQQATIDRLLDDKLKEKIV